MGVVFKNNRWYYRAKQQRNGKRPMISLGPGIKTRAQAEQVALTIEKKKLDERLGLLDPNRTTLKAFIEEYLSHRERLPYAKGTVKKDRTALKSLAEVVGEHTSLNAITPKRIAEWQGLLMAKGVKPQSANAYLRHIKAALNTAQDWGRLSKVRKLKPIKEPKRLPRHLTIEELSEILKAESDQRKKQLWQFFVWTAARREEVANLTWEMIHLGDKPYCRLIGKGDKERLVPLLPEAVRALGKPKDLGPVWRFKGCGVGRLRTPHVDTLSHWFKDAARIANVKPFINKKGKPDSEARLHDLRHTAITYMLSRGVKPRLVQEIAGHASITTTEGYSKALVADLYEGMMEGLDNKK